VGERSGKIAGLYLTAPIRAKCRRMASHREREKRKIAEKRWIKEIAYAQGREAGGLGTVVASLSEEERKNAYQVRKREWSEYS